MSMHLESKQKRSHLLPLLYAVHQHHPTILCTFTTAFTLHLGPWGYSIQWYKSTSQWAAGIYSMNISSVADQRDSRGDPQNVLGCVGITWCFQACLALEAWQGSVTASLRIQTRDLPFTFLIICTDRSQWIICNACIYPSTGIIES